MPDLTVEHYPVCESARVWSTTVEGITGRHTVTWEPGSEGWNYRCTCKGFRFRRSCRHVEEARKQHCNWNGFVKGVSEAQECPKCGGPVFIQGYGV